MTPLHWAAQNGHVKVASILTEHGANTELANKFNLTPIDIALQIKCLDIVQIINAKQNQMAADTNLNAQIDSLVEDENSNCAIIGEELPLGESQHNFVFHFNDVYCFRNCTFCG